MNACTQWANARSGRVHTGVLGTTNACVGGFSGPAMRLIAGRLCQPRGRCGKGEAVGTQPGAGQGARVRSVAGHLVAWAPVGACPGEICECPRPEHPATAPPLVLIQAHMGPPQDLYTLLHASVRAHSGAAVSDPGPGLWTACASRTAPRPVELSWGGGGGKGHRGGGKSCPLLAWPSCHPTCGQHVGRRPWQCSGRPPLWMRVTTLRK